MDVNILIMMTVGINTEVPFHWCALKGQDGSKKNTQHSNEYLVLKLLRINRN